MSKLPESKTAAKYGEEADEFATKIFVKSGYPKTLKENIKLILNLFITFFS